MSVTLLDSYTKEEIYDLEKIYRTYNFKYCPIVFSAENAEASLKKELLELWEKAKLEVEQTYPDFYSHVWRIGRENFKQLCFSNESITDALLLFWKKLKELAGERWDKLKDYYIQLSTKEVAFLNEYIESYEIEKAPLYN